jgi:hypothetical protein
MLVLKKTATGYGTSPEAKKENHGMRPKARTQPSNWIGHVLAQTPKSHRAVQVYAGHNREPSNIDPIIFSRKPLKPNDFNTLNRHLQETLRIPVNDLGQVVAGNGHTHQSAWTRDAAAIGLAMDDKDLQKKIFKALYDGYSRQRDRINNLNHPYGRHLWTSPDANSLIPHTKFTATDKGLESLNHNWGHQQLDAFGYFLEGLVEVAKDGKLDLKDFDNQHPGSESTLVAMVRMLKNISYHDNFDLGTWESHWQRGRLSSVAAVVSALVSVKEWLETSGTDAFPRIDNANIGLDSQRFMKELNHAIEQGKEVIQDRLNADVIQEVASEEGAGSRGDDAALLFMLSIADPKKIGISPEQQYKILESVYRLMGPFGFRRFETDNYMSRDWIKNEHHPVNNHNGEFGHLKDPKDAAEWCLFDPYLATVNYRLFLDSLSTNKPDVEAYYRGDAHTRRALAHITTESFTYDRTAYHDGPGMLNSRIINNNIPQGAVLESFFKYGDEGLYLPGENNGLNWTKAAIIEMLRVGTEASSALEIYQKSQMKK